jgi:Protein kinase domain/Alpha/beta hydrolase family
MDIRMVAPAAHSSERVLPERVGSYALVRRIGSGGMGEVWLGQHVVSGTLGAVKRVSPLVAGPVQDFFRREGRAIARLAHPHIVPVIELGDDFLVTAFIDGANLARRLQTPMDPATAVRIVRQIASALAHAHERGVVHRDVKPSNILIDQRGTAYLADFGVATFADEDTRHRIAGTPRFMAPEQRRAERVGPAADQYALGRTLLEMLVGGAVPNDPGKAMADLPPSLPEPLRAAIMRATAPEIAHRFPTVDAFADAIGMIELGDVPAEWRLAPVARASRPFGWLAGARRVSKITADVERADYRLRDLVARGLMPAAEVDAFLRAHGIKEFGFSVWATTARLGAITDPMLMARAAELAVLMHGWTGTREVWRLVAAAVCRDNAQVVVITPDLHGFGETEFDGVPDYRHVGVKALARSVEALRRLLGLADIPVALVGHSMAATSLLSIDDADIGPHVSRVVINPVLVSHDRKLYRRMRGIAYATDTLFRIPALRRAIVHWTAHHDPNLAVLTLEARETCEREALRMPRPVLSRLMSAFRTAPPKIGRQRRVAVLVCLDDDWVREESLDAAAAELGLERAQIHRMVSGGHNPHVELADHPEWTARNIDHIVRVIDSMLITAREVTMVSTEPRAVSASASSNEATATAQTFTRG